jgi:hypothetical protein
MERAMNLARLKTVFIGFIGTRIDSSGVGRTISLVIILLSANPAFAQTIHFERTTINLDTINQTDKALGYFIVYNTGDGPLVVSKIVGSSGSVVTHWNKNPIEPGDSSSIAVQCDIRKRFGKLNNNIWVTSNCQSTSKAQLYLNGFANT